MAVPMSPPRSLLVAVLACACTGPNPAFLAPLTGASGEVETASDGATADSSVTTGGATTTTTGPGTSMGGPSTSNGGSVTGDLTATVSSTDPPLTTAAESTSGETTGAVDSSSGEPGSTGQPCMKVPHYLDGDGDGFGDPEAVVFACEGLGPAGWIPEAGDCNDADKGVNPGAIEVCNQFDDNCDGLRDEYSPMNAKCGGCKMAESVGHFYWVCAGPKAPKDVNALCQMAAVGPGAKAYHVQITSEVEHNVVVDLMVALNMGDVSIGLRDTKLLNLMLDHRWVVDEAMIEGFGVAPGLFPWAIPEPSLPVEDWVTIRLSDKLWNDRKGIDAMPFACEGEPKP